MNISIIGGGYVGLVSAVCFSDLGNHVNCIEKHTSKYQQLCQGMIPFYEPELSEKFKKNIEKKRLCIHNKLNSSLLDVDVIMLAVGTPMSDTGEADLSDLFSVVDHIIELASSQAPSKPIVLTTKSTVPVGTGKKIEAKVVAAGLSSLIYVASNPEFLREGSAVYDFFHPDRIVIGCRSNQSFKILEALYKPVSGVNRPIIQTSTETSELSNTHPMHF